MPSTRSPYRAPGTVSANPDWSMMQIGVEQEAQTVEEAQAATAEAMDKIKQALLDNGVESENIRTAEFYVRPDYQYLEDRQELRAFIVQHILHVEYGDIENVGRLLDDAARAGANRIHKIRFTVRDSNSLETEALEKAVERARTKAEVLAKASGKTIVNIHRIVESDARAGLPIYETAMFADSAKSATSLEVGPVEVKQNISVTFEVE